MRRYLKVILGAAAFVLVAVGYAGLVYEPAGSHSPLQVQAQGQEPDRTMRTVQVSGAGEVRTEPDMAVIRLGVQTEDDTAQAALTQNNTQMQAILDVLEDADIASENIQTQTVRLSPRYEFDNNNRTLVGYTASNIVEVRTEDLGALGTLVDQAVEAGANTIEGISFEISDPGNLMDQARQAAVQNARHKAEELADLTGASLGPILEIRESSNAPVPVEQPLEPAAETAAVPISPGSQRISVNVQMTWTLITSTGQ